MCRLPLTQALIKLFKGSRFVMFYVACAHGLEPLLRQELELLGLTQLTLTNGGVRVTGTLHAAQRIVLWSRIASRVLWPLHMFSCQDADALYAGVFAIDWPTHLEANHTLAVDAHLVQSTLRNTHFAALRVKDAIVDQIRSRYGQRPSVDLHHTDIRLHLVVHHQRATLSLDLSGGAMHRRGWRRNGHRAPLKETLAAAVVRMTGWPEVFHRGGGVVDPMCGSGTLLIEAALLAADVAPGLQRLQQSTEQLGLPTQWLGFDRQHWQLLVAQAQQRGQKGLAALPAVFWGVDCDSQAIEAAQANAQSAGLAQAIHFQLADMAVASYPDLRHGIVISNPPYNARMQADTGLYRRLGQTLRQHLPHWRTGLLCGDPVLASATGLKAQHSYPVFNGQFKCCLIVGDHHETESKIAPPPALLDDGTHMVCNRLRKNRRVLGRWLNRTGTSCYRIYDADIPEYAAAVDVYQAAIDHDDLYLHIQEYTPPAHIPQDAIQRRREALLAAVQTVFQVPPDKIAFKQRQRQHHKEGQQYQRSGQGGPAVLVREHNALLQVNLFDYFDTGLFLDLRLLRGRIADETPGRRFLNLFCYTGAASVQAALAGAANTTSVDLSATYLQWCADNFAFNKQTGPRHRLIQADVMAWLSAEHGKYDVIFCDPPTFSNSARSADFDIQRHHVQLLAMAIARLSADGVVYFSNHYRRFKLDSQAIDAFAHCQEITEQTRDLDFKRNVRIHRAWRLQPKVLSSSSIGRSNFY